VRGEKQANFHEERCEVCCAVVLDVKRCRL
jgi:hypothetical protein